MAEAARSDPEKLGDLPVPLESGSKKVVLLKQVSNFSFVEGQNQISRENGKRRVVVTANVRGRDLSSVVQEAQAKVAEQVRPPAGY